MDEDDHFIQKLSGTRAELAEGVKETTQWLKDSLKSITSRKKVFEKSGTPTIGEMFLFVYDPKYKHTLPYYDMYPLVFPIEFYGNGFLGMNLHYLPPGARAVLMDNLKKITNNDKYNSSTKLMVSYEVLSAHARRFSGFENCIKRYLFAHVRSSFHQVSPADWDKAIMLPLQRWSVNPNKKYAQRPPY